MIEIPGAPGPVTDEGKFVEIRRKGADARYSVRTLSAHCTRPTKIVGLANVAFLPARSLSRTPRALEQAPQT